MPHAPPSDAVSPTTTGVFERSGEEALRDSRRAEDAPVGEHAVELDALLLEHPHADREGAEDAVQLGAHEVGEREAAVGGADDERTTLAQTGDRLARQVVVGQQAARVGVAVERLAEERLEHLVGARACRRRRVAKRSNSPTQAASSLAPLLQCTIATGSPAGVVTTSSSSCTLASGRSSTTIAKMLVPALTLPVRGATEHVATMPVPASPSGGHSGMPGCSAPDGSSSARPPRVRRPASRPATSTSGSSSARDRP